MFKIPKQVLVLTFLFLIPVGAGLIYFNMLKTGVTKSVKIGVIATLGSNNNNMGFNILKGINLAKKDLDSDITVIQKDTDCNPALAEAAMQEFAATGVVAVIGEVCSAASIKALEVANKYKIPMISPASTSERLSIKNDMFFRTIPSDEAQGKFLAELIYSRGYKTLAIIYSNEAYGIGLADRVYSVYDSLGGKIVKSVSYQRGETTSFQDIVKQVKSLNPDAVFVVTNSSTDAVDLLKTIKESKIKSKLFGSEVFSDTLLMQDAGDAADGLVSTSVTFGTENFIYNHKSEYGIEPGTYAAQGYDAFMALQLALESGARSGTEIANYLQSLSFAGATGEVSFNDYGDFLGQYQALEYKDGSFLKY